MKCSCDAERSFNSEALHLAMKSLGVMGSLDVSVADCELLYEHPDPPASYRSLFNLRRFLSTMKMVTYESDGDS